MNNVCGYKWRATHLLAPWVVARDHQGRVHVSVYGDRVKVEQTCVLERGHEGDHRSLTNVIAPVSVSGGKETQR